MDNRYLYDYYFDFRKASFTYNLSMIFEFLFLFCFSWALCADVSPVWVEDGGEMHGKQTKKTLRHSQSVLTSLCSFTCHLLEVYNHMLL